MTLAGHMLSDDDMAIVKSITGDVERDDVARIIEIHRTHLVANRSRLKRLEAEVASVLRSIAMREASIKELESR